MEQLFAVETEHFKRKTAGMLAWMLDIPRTRRDGVELYGRMAEEWPVEGTIVREVLEGKRNFFG